VSTTSYEQTVDVETPELVVLTYSIAGIGSRAMAAITDLLIVAGVFAVLGIIFAAVVATGGFGGFDFGGSWGVAILILVQFALLWGYYVLFEGLMDGQTPGKRVHRIRVVREGGYSVTFGASAVRNLIRIIDMQPLFLYLVGMISVLATRRGRRLGDIVAGTIVVREDARRAAAPTPSTPMRERREHAATLQTQLSEDEYLVLSRFVERWSTLEALKRAALAQQLAKRLAAGAAGRRRSCTGAEAARAVRAGAPRARRRRGVAWGDGRGARAPGAHRGGKPALEHLRLASGAGAAARLRSLGEDGVREFVAEYRALSADLARLRTASGGRQLDELFQLGRPGSGRAQSSLSRPRHGAARLGALPLHRGPARGATLGRDRSRSPRCSSSAPRSSPA
jgi:uncharacterized RDD family membrane protein YckC